MTIEILKNYQCPSYLIEHSIAVCKKAVKLSSNFDLIDLKLVKTGAMLHDIGRCETNGVNHAIVGAQILSELGFREEISNIALRHIGAGIPKEEAIKLGLPPKDYMPISLEEKVVAHADNLVHWKSEVGIDFVIKKWEEKLGKNHPSIKRLIVLHNEIVEDI